MPLTAAAASESACCGVFWCTGRFRGTPSGGNRSGGAMVRFSSVVASAGTVHYLTLEQIKSSIREAGWEPRQRNVFYQLIDTPVQPRRPEAPRSLPVLS